MPLRPLRTKVAQILNQLLAGEISAEQAFAIWPAEEEYVEDPILREAYHALQHYMADEDIRSRNTEYAHGQQEELREVAQRLMSRSTEPASSSEATSAPRANSSSRGT